jgi:hypothetical protein
MLCGLAALFHVACTAPKLWMERGCIMPVTITPGNDQNLNCLAVHPIVRAILCHTML